MQGTSRSRMSALRWTAICGAALLATGTGLAASPTRSPPIHFTDEAQRRGVQDLAVNSTGPTFGDYDNDGDLDLFVPVEDLAPGLADRLFENDGSGMFRDVAAERGVQNPGSLNRGAVFCDFDNDGDLDLLAANMPPGQAREKHVPTTLFRNQLKETGAPRFENVTRAARLMRAGQRQRREDRRRRRHGGRGRLRRLRSRR